MANLLHAAHDRAGHVDLLAFDILAADVVEEALPQTKKQTKKRKKLNLRPDGLPRDFRYHESLAKGLVLVVTLHVRAHPHSSGIVANLREDGYSPSGD